MNGNEDNYYAGTVGVPAAMGESGVDRVKVVSYWNANAASASSQVVFDAYKKKYSVLDDPYTQGIRNSVDLLVKAMTTVKSTDPVKVARAMEDMKMEDPFGEVVMRGADHQMIQPLFIATFVKASSGKFKYMAEGTSEYAFRQEVRYEGPATARPTTCKMQRP